MNKIHDTREGWLLAAARELEATLKTAKAKMPAAWAVSCGFPSRQKYIGECWDKVVSAGGRYEMFISPALEKPVDVLATLLHEMIHAAAGLECKHTGEFRRIARAVGLKGKLTATYAEEGTELYTALAALGDKLGKYPHSAMTRRKKAAVKTPYFLLKLVSPNDPDYKFTIAPRLVEQYGMPKDYMGDEMVEAT